jgi:hypothetical protein
MERVEFTITGEGGKSLRVPGSIENFSDLPVLAMRAVENFLETHEGQLRLPITIFVRPASDGLTR